ncbi:MAG: hypothetical protein AAF360_20260 [Pseudomonadota bacterium]
MIQLNVAGVSCGALHRALGVRRLKGDDRSGGRPTERSVRRLEARRRTVDLMTRILGGATRDLLEATTHPLLMAH